MPGTGKTSWLSIIKKDSMNFSTAAFCDPSKSQCQRMVGKKPPDMVECNEVGGFRETIFPFSLLLPKPLEPERTLWLEEEEALIELNDLLWSKTSTNIHSVTEISTLKTWVALKIANIFHDINTELQQTLAAAQNMRTVSKVYDLRDKGKSLWSTRAFWEDRIMEAYLRGQFSKSCPALSASPLAQKNTCYRYGTPRYLSSKNAVERTLNQAQSKALIY